MEIRLSDIKYFCDGDGNFDYSQVIGWESDRTRIVRFNFTTGDTGATSITINTKKGAVIYSSGEFMSKIPFYVTTSDSSHADALVSDGYAVTGYLTQNDDVWSGTANVLLKENTKYYIWFFPYDKTYGWSWWIDNDSAYTTCELSGTSRFTLSMSAGVGSEIGVSRTMSALGASLAEVGRLTDGANIYKGDKLQITFTPSANYGIDVHTVNGSPFTSGNTHTVSSDVSVVSTAYLLASRVGATDANIGSKSSITVTKYNSSYYHSLQYTFGDMTGYITNSGDIQSEEIKYGDTNISFTVPISFYEQIPNSKTGICTIICRTYSSLDSTVVLGSPSVCTFTVTATGYPTIKGSIIDVDPTTIGLTGNSSVLIRYRSDAKCTLTAIPKNAASISTMQIRDDVIAGVFDNGTTTAETTYTDAAYETSYSFSATDSRGYTSSISIRPIIVNYIQLTCNPVISRPTPTGSSIVMTVTGSLYRGSFGRVTNSLTLDYRYKTIDGVYGAWQSIDSSNITLGSSQYTVENFSLGDDFDYNTRYVFQVRARDGSSDYVLSTVVKTVEVQKGIPVFDWGENDFNFNVPVRIGNIDLLDIFYPVGSVYMSITDTVPATLSNQATWEQIATGIDGIYGWKRSA